MRSRHVPRTVHRVRGHRGELPHRPDPQPTSATGCGAVVRSTTPLRRARSASARSPSPRAGGFVPAGSLTNVFALVGAAHDDVGVSAPTSILSPAGRPSRRARPAGGARRRARRAAVGVLRAAVGRCRGRQDPPAQRAAHRGAGGGWQVVVGHCLDFGDSTLPYLPFSEVFGRLAGEQPALAQRVRRGLPRHRPPDARPSTAGCADDAGGTAMDRSACSRRCTAGSAMLAE